MRALAFPPADASLRFLPVTSDNMEPELRVGRHMVLVRPCTAWEGEGMYLMADGVIRQCGFAGAGRVGVYNLNPSYPTRAILSRDEFTAEVSGRIVGSLKVEEPDAQDRLWGAVYAERRRATLAEAA